VCNHKKVEIVGRIENFNGKKHVNIYNCKKCGSSVIFLNHSPQKIDYRYFK
jgi:hypothetical protein